MSDGSADSDLLPLRMVVEFVYCPRLFHLMHVEGRWADNTYTLEGTEAHRRLDRAPGALPPPPPQSDEPEGGEKDRTEEDERPQVVRSVALDSVRLGISARLDLMSLEGDRAVPVETKRGRVPSNPERSWEPERVQLMAQGLLLREQGYTCDHGVIYYAGSRRRVEIPFTPELEARTLRYIEAARGASRRRTLPDPLEDSPKCIGCSLAGICLPDETLALRIAPPDPPEHGFEAVRRLYPARDDAVPLYVQEQGSRVGKSGGTLVVRKGDEKLGEAKIKDVSQLVLCGRVSISPQAMHVLCEASVPIVLLSRGHWFYGLVRGMGLRNAYDRAAQFETARQPEKCLEFARAVVLAKGTNQRRLLVRHLPDRGRPTTTEISTLLKKVPHATDLDELLGLEGAIASKYFGRFAELLKDGGMVGEWGFDRRNRRPPTDPVNAMLSFGYALLVKECTVALLSEGLDPWWGLYHQPRHGRPALALDLMEEFRPLIVDSAVLSAVNNQMVSPKDFIRSGEACLMEAKARKAFIRAYEIRMDQLLTHPLFGYRCSWRSIIRVQARLLARWLRGDVPAYRGVTTR